MNPNERASGGQYSVRKASSGDVNAVARIWHVGWGDGHIGFVPPELVRHRDEKQFLTRAEARVDDMWVAERDGLTVGFVVVKSDEVEQVYVDRAARGTGVAELLLLRAEAEIRACGHGRAWLVVVEGNERARRFYSRLGWREAGPMTYHAETEDGPLPIPTLRYEIDLIAAAGSV